MSVIDHEYTREPICPYCGYEKRDAWELSDDGETECGECEREYSFTRNVSVTWSTEPIES